MTTADRLYIDTWNHSLVSGVKSLTSRAWNRFVYGNKHRFHVYLLDPSESTPFAYPSPFSIRSVANLSLRMAIAQNLDTSSVTYLCSQGTWTKSSDNTYLYADFDLATVPLSGAMGSLEYIEPWWQIDIDEVGELRTVLQTQVKVYKRAIDTTTPDPLPEEPLLTRSEGFSAFVLNEEPAGAFRIRTSPSGKRWREWIDDDGVMHWDPMT